MNVHNLIIGTPYLDVDFKSEVRNVANRDTNFAQVQFFKRGWSATSYHRVEGQVYSAPGQIAYKLEGKWSDKVFLIDEKTGERELVYEKPPYPENVDYMYGMSYYNL